MDTPRDTDRPDVLERGGGRDDRGRADLRDVLSRLVVDDGGPEVTLRAVARAAGGSDRLVPALLTALDDEATAVRVGASWTLCALADDQPAAVEFLTERVAERAGDDAPFEVGQVLSYLRGRYPKRVADALDVAAAQDSLGEPTSGHSPRGRVESPAGDATARTDGAARADTPARTDGGETGRIRTDGGVPAGSVTDLGDGRQVVRPDRGGDGGPRPVRPDRPPEPTVTSADSRSRPPVQSRSRARPDRQSPAQRPTHPTDAGFGGNGAAEEPTADASVSGRTDSRESVDGPTTTTPDTSAEPDRSTPVDPAGPPAVEDDHRPETPETFASIAALSDFDRLSAVAHGVEERYATGYRCRAAVEDDERGVAARLFDRPEESDRLDFRAALADALGRWEALGDGDSVVAVVDWGERPRPWVATQPVDASLADRGRPPVDRAVDQAVALADALGHCHRHGAVHGGLDPKSVVYPGDGLTGLDEPILDNPGLMGVFRRYFEPADYLDPRFAAPEYFDDDFGAVDTATDVYGLGAVCYFLLTGRPPFDGSYSAVRRGVLTASPDAPSAVADAAPADADPVLAKALAKRKLKRYDSVEAFAADLRRVRDRAD